MHQSIDPFPSIVVDARTAPKAPIWPTERSKPPTRVAWPNTTHNYNYTALHNYNYNYNYNYTTQLQLQLQLKVQLQLQVPVVPHKAVAEVSKIGNL